MSDSDKAQVDCHRFRITQGRLGFWYLYLAIFAAAWAQEFFTEFLGGKELGDVMLTLRQRFLEERKNPMGLLYAVHCNGNTRVEPGVGLTAS